MMYDNMVSPISSECVKYPEHPREKDRLGRPCLDEHMSCMEYPFEILECPLSGAVVLVHYDVDPSLGIVGIVD